MISKRTLPLLAAALCLMIGACAKRPPSYIATSAAPPDAAPPPHSETPHTLQPVQPQPAGVIAAPPSIPSFPWPPPQASTQVVLPNDFFMAGQHSANLGSVDDRLTAALFNAGYSERAYFAVPDGFAVVTKLEQIDDDGTSKQPPARWVTTNGGGSSIFSLSDYLRALFTANTGYYRVIAFIVTDAPFSATGAKPSEDQTVGWLHSGLNTLPAAIKQEPFSTGHSCTAMIYEFQRAANSQPSLTSSGPDAATHLQKAGIWDKLKGGQ